LIRHIDPYGFLSPSFKINFFVGATEYKSVEHYYSQSLSFYLSPENAEPTDVEELEKIREDSMREGNRQKFRDPELKSLLDETEEKQLRYYSNDVHFGCLKGGNKLGEIIMEIRKSNRL
jgi:predicted NAD-dependent protein-ADP-ribosyltransferase YbiA (DUF1768 family)